MAHGRLSRVEAQLKQQIDGTADELSEEIGEMRELTQKLAEQERRRKVELLQRRAVGRIRNSLTVKAFAAWHTNTSDHVRRTRLAKRAIGRVCNLCMGHAYNRWAGAVRTARNKRQKMLLEEQALQMQQVLSRLDPNGADFVVPLACSSSAVLQQLS